MTQQIPNQSTARHASRWKVRHLLETQFQQNAPALASYLERFSTRRLLTTCFKKIATHCFKYQLPETTFERYGE
ncbi:hypothetical protein NZK35_22150 [Stieleria sp. ICT_E10.1]|uniref:hypothetical protein n=1 Tax=Stieleria sedimenti TaxID=2976331 RepID=UPI00217FAFB4|nr:hypothetical protein [Stieleria sedimenti]MCS7469363.1 hypothetical protein [Stieleria sedimenti]